MFAEAVRHFVDTLQAAGVRASADPEKLNPPCVWVTPNTYSGNRLDNTAGEGQLVLYLLTQSKTSQQALRALDDLLEAVQAAGVNVRDVEAVQVALPNHNAGGLPAYRAPIDYERTA